MVNNTKVFIIEGLPGSGKSMFSKRLEQYFKNEKKTVKRYSEGDLHPIDLAWCSVTDKQTFDNLCDEFHEVKNQIIKHTKQVGNQYITPYTKIDLTKNTKHLDEVFRQYEIYRTNELDVFKQTHLDLWRQFAKAHDADTIYIFECVFLQNHINELLLNMDVHQDAITPYFQDLIQALSPIKPTIFYVNQQDIADRLAFITEQRKTNDKALYNDWIDNVLTYMKNTKHGKSHNYLGYDGFLRYLYDRKATELKIIKQLDGCACHVLDLKDDYDQVFSRMIAQIERRDAYNENN